MCMYTLRDAMMARECSHTRSNEDQQGNIPFTNFLAGKQIKIIFQEFIDREFVEKSTNETYIFLDEI